MTTVELLDGPDVNGKQDVVATATANGNDLTIAGPRAHWAKQLVSQMQSRLAVKKGQIDPDTLKLTGELPGAEETLSYWLSTNEPPQRIRAGNPHALQPIEK